MRRHLLCLPLLLVPLACDRTEQPVPTPTPIPTPTQQAAVPSDPVASATTEPVPATPAYVTILIDGKPELFPPARLVRKPSRSVLLTIDPKDALGNDYTGNDFFFEMKLPAESSTWTYSAESLSEMPSGPNRISLSGGERNLKPGEITVTFEPGATETIIRLEGQFLEAVEGSTPMVRTIASVIVISE